MDSPDSGSACSLPELSTAVLEFSWLADPMQSRCPPIRTAMLQVLEVRVILAGSLGRHRPSWRRVLSTGTVPSPSLSARSCSFPRGPRKTLSCGIWSRRRRICSVDEIACRRVNIVDYFWWYDKNSKMLHAQLVHCGRTVRFLTAIRRRTKGGVIAVELG